MCKHCSRLCLRNLSPDFPPTVPGLLRGFATERNNGRLEMALQCLFALLKSQRFAMRWCRNPCINLWGFVALTRWQRTRKSRSKRRKKKEQNSALIFGRFSGRNNIFCSECFSKPTSRPERGGKEGTSERYLFILYA